MATWQLCVVWKAASASPRGKAGLPDSGATTAAASWRKSEVTRRPFAVLVADIPAVHDTPLYLLLGDWFGWLSLATLALTLAQFYRLCKDPNT